MGASNVTNVVVTCSSGNTTISVGATQTIAVGGASTITVTNTGTTYSAYNVSIVNKPSQVVKKLIAIHI